MKSKLKLMIVSELEISRTLLSNLLSWDLFRRKMGYERLRQKRFFKHLLGRQLHQTKTLWLFIINRFMLRIEMQFINGQLTISHAVFALSIEFFVLIVDALKAILLAFFLLFLWEATKKHSAALYPEKGNHSAQLLFSHAKRNSIRLKAINYRSCQIELRALSSIYEAFGCKSSFNLMMGWFVRNGSALGLRDRQVDHDWKLKGKFTKKRLANTLPAVTDNCIGKA